MAEFTFDGHAQTSEAIVVDDSVTTLTVSNLSNQDGSGGSNPSGAIIQILAEPVRFTVDGTDPVATSGGKLAAANDIIKLYGADNLQNFKMIRDGATNAIAQVHYLVR